MSDRESQATAPADIFTRMDQNATKDAERIFLAIGQLKIALDAVGIDLREIAVKPSDAGKLEHFLMSRLRDLLMHNRGGSPRGFTVLDVAIRAEQRR